MKLKKDSKMAKFKKILFLYLISLFIIISVLLLLGFYYSSFNYILFRNYKNLNLYRLIIYILIISPPILYYFLSFYLIDEDIDFGYFLIIFVFIIMFITNYYISCK